MGNRSTPCIKKPKPHRDLKRAAMPVLARDRDLATCPDRTRRPLLHHRIGGECVQHEVGFEVAMQCVDDAAHRRGAQRGHYQYLCFHPG